MNETNDMLVFWTVVLVRFTLPLAIPRFPLPGILASLVVDAADQTIFQEFTNLNLAGYQGYDKALDIYYLALAYMSTLRNWGNLFALRVSRSLWYYRLAGVTLFELSEWRPLLLVFPNTFEYFFIFYEIVRLRWNPRRLTERATIVTAAVLWIFVKLPQEYWIHIAELDTTDFMKTAVFGASLDTSWIVILTANLWIIPVFALLVAAATLLIRWLLRKLPPADWPLNFDADAPPEDDVLSQAQRVRASWLGHFFNSRLLEKVVLLALVSITFGQVMPGLRVTNLHLAVGIVFIVLANSLVSQWLAKQGIAWDSTLIEFAAMAVLNYFLALFYEFLLPELGGGINVNHVLFFALLITLIVVLLDRYHPIYRQRKAESA